ncbi:MAG: hypothetical protein M3Q23_15595 [Actinomycetota bacterium]|nr:hypothetical protein [Actinomycetota bacterium]
MIEYLELRDEQVTRPSQAVQNAVLSEIASLGLFERLEVRFPEDRDHDPSPRPWGSEDREARLARWTWAWFHQPGSRTWAVCLLVTMDGRDGEETAAASRPGSKE